MRYAEGDILTGEGFVSGYVGFNQQTGLEVGKGRAPQKSFTRGIIVPTFVNAHTHIGDSFIRAKKNHASARRQDTCRAARRVETSVVTRGDRG